MRTVLVEELRGKKKPLGSSIVQTVKVFKAVGQACNTSPINDEMELKCLIYLFNKHIT